jgi:hypothetical protein
MTRVGDYMNQKDTIDQAVQLMQGWSCGANYTKYFKESLLRVKVT